MRISTVTACLLAFVVFVSSSQAQDPAPVTGTTSDTQNVIERARKHFERGVEHYSAGDYDAALAEFQRTYELRPSYKLLFNLAQVQVERRDHAAALRLFNEYLRRGGSEIAAERAREVERELQRLRQSVAEISFRIDVGGARIFVDAAQVGVSPVPEPVLVNAGSSLIRIEKAGHIPYVESLILAGGDRRELEVTLEPLTAAAPAARPEHLVAARTRAEAAPNLTPFWITLGATVVLGGATVTLGALSLHARSQQETLLGTYPGRPSEIQSASDRFRTFATLTDVFAGATAVAGIVGLYFALSPPEREVAPAQRAALRVRATPGGVVFTGTF